MAPVTALNLRRIGLMLEAVCILALLAVARKNAEPELVLGVPVYRILQAGLGLGLVLWIVGTLAYARAKWRGDS